MRRVVVVSCLDVFERYGADLAVDENFMPRPTMSPTQLGPHLTEFLAREFAHTHGALDVTVARIGVISTGTAGGAEGRAVAGVAALLQEDDEATQGRRSNGQFFNPPGERTRFTITHLDDTGAVPRAASTLPFPEVAPVPPRELERVLILGGGGILGPPVVEELGDSYTLRVTDVHASKRNPGSRPLVIPDQHEYVELDIATESEVIAAIDGTDAVVNLSVMRLDRKLAFDVNTSGTYHAIRAAVAAVSPPPIT